MKGNCTQSAVYITSNINSIQQMALDVLYFTRWCLLFSQFMVKLSSLSYSLNLFFFQIGETEYVKI